jgi:hypothetical protein
MDETGCRQHPWRQGGAGSRWGPAHVWAKIGWFAKIPEPLVILIVYYGLISGVVSVVGVWSGSRTFPTQFVYAPFCALVRVHRPEYSMLAIRACYGQYQTRAWESMGVESHGAAQRWASVGD